MKRFLSLLLMWCCFAPPLFAKSITNQELMTACKDKTPAPQNFCYGFIIGAANAAQFYRNLVDLQDEYIDICFPENVSNKEMVDLFIAWVEKNPKLSGGPAFIGVSSSFSAKYSCKTEKEDKKP